MPFMTRRITYRLLKFTKMLKPIVKIHNFDYPSALKYDGNFKLLQEPIIPNFFPIIYPPSDNNIDISKQKKSQNKKINSNPKKIKNAYDERIRCKKREFKFLQAFDHNKCFFSYIKQRVHFFGMTLNRSMIENHEVKFTTSQNLFYSLVFNNNIQKMSISENFIYISTYEFLLALRINRQTDLNSYFMELAKYTGSKERQINDYQIEKATNIKDKVLEVENQNHIQKLLFDQKNKSTLQNTLQEEQHSLNNQEQTITNFPRPKKIFRRKHTTFCINCVNNIAMIRKKRFYFYRASKLKYSTKFNKDVDYIFASPHATKFYIIQQKHLYLFDCEENTLENIASFPLKIRHIKEYENGLIIVSNRIVHIYDRKSYKNQNSIASFYHGISCPSLEVNDCHIIVYSNDGVFLFFDKFSLSCKRVYYQFHEFEGFTTNKNMYYFFFKQHILIFENEHINFDFETKFEEFRNIFNQNRNNAFFQYENMKIFFRPIPGTQFKIFQKFDIKYIKYLFKKYKQKKSKPIYKTSSILYDRLNGEKDTEDSLTSTRIVEKNIEEDEDI